MRLRTLLLLLPALLLPISFIAGLYFFATAENCTVYNGSCPDEETRTTRGFNLLVVSAVCLITLLISLVVITWRRIKDPGNKIELP